MSMRIIYSKTEQSRSCRYTCVDIYIQECDIWSNGMMRWSEQSIIYIYIYDSSNENAYQGSSSLSFCYYVAAPGLECILSVKQQVFVPSNSLLFSQFISNDIQRYTRATVLRFALYLSVNTTDSASVRLSSLRRMTTHQVTTLFLLLLLRQRSTQREEKKKREKERKRRRERNGGGLGHEKGGETRGVRERTIRETIGKNDEFGIVSEPKNCF